MRTHALPLAIIAVLATACSSDRNDRVRSDDDASPGTAADTERLLPRVLERVDETSVDSAVAAFYRSSDGRPLWIAEESDHRSEMGEALERAFAEGVPTADLDLDTVRAFLRTAGEGSDAERVDAELRLSEALLTLAGVYARGSALREESEVDWSMDRDPEPGADVLAQVGRDGVTATLDSLRPELAVYHRTVEALDRYRHRHETGAPWPRVEASDAPVVERGEAHPVVTAVRERLRASVVERERELAESGVERPDRLDAELAGAIARFQARHGIAVDSVVGPETIEAMNVPISERIDQLVLNLDRIRRLPHDFGERAILVNVAGFELRVLERNRPVMEMAVVVGQPEWRTNVFSDSIEHLVINPYWHVPESIEAAETLPSVKADPGYLAANRISVVPADDNFGAPVDPGSIDWASMSAADMPYDFRQEPGPSNALGQIKFMFPNAHNIYLHDTPAEALFQKDFRAFSHGCIRVERPWELARYIVENATDRTEAELRAIRDSRERTRVELNEPVPVFITYLTTWVDDEGTVSFHQDLYDYDERAEAALGGGA